MPDAEGDLIKSLAEKIPMYEKDMVGIFDTMLSRAMRQVGATTAKEFADGWKKEVDKTDLDFSAKFKKYMANYTQLAKEAEDIRSRYFFSAEKQRLDRFNATYAENKKTLQEFYDFERNLILKSTELNQKEKDKKISDLNKKSAEDLLALDKGTEKQRTRLALEEASSRGNLVAKAQLAGMNLLGSIGKGGLATLAGAFSIEAISNVLSETTKLSAARAQAGVGGTGTMFGGVPAGIVSPIERMQLTTQILKDAPRLITDSGESLRTFTGYMGFFGVGIEESTKLLIRAQRNLGMQTADVTNTIVTATGLNQRYGISVSETADNLLDMTNSLRMIGMSSRDAAAIMSAIPTKTSLGVVSPEELKSYTTALSRFIGGMSVSQTAGIMAFMKGGGIPSDAQIKAGLPNMAGTIGGLYQRLKEQTGELGQRNPMLIAEAFSKSMGLGISATPKSMEVLNEIMSQLKPGSIDDLYKKLEERGIKPTEKILEDGFSKLADIQGIMKNLDKVLQEVFVPLAIVLGPVLSLASKTLSATGGYGAATATGAAIGGIPGAGIGLSLDLISALLRMDNQVPGRVGIGQQH